MTMRSGSRSSRRSIGPRCPGCSTRLLRSTHNARDSRIRPNGHERRWEVSAVVKLVCDSYGKDGPSAADVEPFTAGDVLARLIAQAVGWSWVTERGAGQRHYCPDCSETVLEAKGGAK